MNEPTTVSLSHELVRGERKPVQDVVVLGMVAVIAILALTVLGLLFNYSKTLNRRAVAQDAVACFSEKQSEFSTGITNLLAASRANDVAAIDKSFVLLHSVHFDDCKKVGK